MSLVEDAVEVELADLGVKLTADAAISDHEREVLLSDRAVEGLGIIILRPGEGLWKHVSDGEGIVRRSSRPEFW